MCLFVVVTFPWFVFSHSLPPTRVLLVLAVQLTDAMNNVSLRRTMRHEQIPWHGSAFMHKRSQFRFESLLVCQSADWARQRLTSSSLLSLLCPHDFLPRRQETSPIRLHAIWWENLTSEDLKVTCRFELCFKVRWDTGGNNIELKVWAWIVLGSMSFISEYSTIQQDKRPLWFIMS